MPIDISHEPIGAIGAAAFDAGAANEMASDYDARRRLRYGMYEDLFHQHLAQQNFLAQERLRAMLQGDRWDRKDYEQQQLFGHQDNLAQQRAQAMMDREMVRQKMHADGYVEEHTRVEQAQIDRNHELRSKLGDTYEQRDMNGPFAHLDQRQWAAANEALLQQEMGVKPRWVKPPPGIGDVIQQQSSYTDAQGNDYQGRLPPGSVATIDRNGGLRVTEAPGMKEQAKQQYDAQMKQQEWEHKQAEMNQKLQQQQAQHEQQMRQQEETHFQNMQMRRAELRMKLKGLFGPDGKPYSDDQVNQMLGDDPEYTPSQFSEPPQWSQYPHPATPDEAAALPPGTVYVTPHGHLKHR